MSQRRTMTRWALCELVAVERLGAPGKRLRTSRAMQLGWLVLAVTMQCLVSPAFGQTRDDSLVGIPAMSHEVPTDTSVAPPPREFGVEAVSILNLGPCSLQRRPISSANVQNDACELVLPASTGSLALGADVQLPAGAVITEVTIHYHDSHTTSNPTFGLFRVSPTGITSDLFNTTPPESFSGGDTTTTIVLAMPETVNNQTNNYIFLVDLNRIGDQYEGFFRAAIKYRRQVSPAPAVATFQDVPPSHPFFQFIQALVASGITVGCGGGNYCVNAAITRGEMAVFLSKALGLHFAP
jgi:hypothetical protein